MDVIHNVLYLYCLHTQQEHCWRRVSKTCCTDEKINEPDVVLCMGLFDSVPDFENILNDADVKLDGVRQKIGQIAEELRGEDLHQFHRAFTPGSLSTNASNV